MKLKRFLEYVDNSNDNKYIPFNDNEIKYLKAFTFCYERDTTLKSYYINFCSVMKLSTGEYYIENLNVKCSTLKTLIKYTSDHMVENKKWFDNILINTKYKTYNSDVIFWYYNDEIWGKQDKRTHSLALNKKFLAKLYDFYNSFAVKLFIKMCLTNIISNKYRIITFLDSPTYKKLKNDDYDNNININESSNSNENNIEISFNRNELKYLKDKGNLTIKEITTYHQPDICYYVNYKQVQKLSDGEFYVVEDCVKCNTIQSLIKYTYDSTKSLCDIIDNLLVNSDITESNLANLYHYKNKYWACLTHAVINNKLNFFVDLISLKQFTKINYTSLSKKTNELFILIEGRCKKILNKNVIVKEY